MKFKIGDKVELRKDSKYFFNRKPWIHTDEYGTIFEVLADESNEDHIYGILWDSSSFKRSNCFLRAIDIQYPKYKNTRLARKMFPKADISECGEWIYV